MTRRGSTRPAFVRVWMVSINRGGLVYAYKHILSHITSVALHTLARALGGGEVVDVQRLQRREVP